jgi:hypothetical protein
MARRPEIPGQPRDKRPPFILVISIIIVCLMIGVGAWAWSSLNLRISIAPATKPTATAAAISVPQQQITPTPIATPNPVSPLIFGANVSLFDQKDQVLTSAETRTMLQQIHPAIIRMPTRQSTLTLNVEIQMAQIIKDMGAAPLIILQGPSTVDPLDYNIHLVQAMNTIFGTGTVYYEYSNEENYFHHLSAQDYVTDWNAMIPALKPLDPNAQFIGPVTSVYEQDYLTTFLQQANPKPDEVSWHEYTCDKGADQNTCLGNIDKWTQHIQSARAAMQALGKVYPIMITEWNYAGNAQSGDGKKDDPQFMTNWTTKALQTLAANRIFASMEYAVSNDSTSLIDNNNAYTPQGMAFRDQYQSIIVNNQQPSPIAPDGA